MIRLIFDRLGPSAHKQNLHVHFNSAFLEPTSGAKQNLIIVWIINPISKVS